MITVDAFVSMLRESFPLPAKVPPIAEGGAPLWLEGQPHLLHRFLTTAQTKIVVLDDAESFLQTAQVSVVYAAHDNSRIAALLCSEKSGKFCWAFAEDVDDLARQLGSDPEKIRALIQMHRFANPFKNPIANRFLQVIRLAVVLERVRLHPIVIDLQSTLDFLFWSIEHLESERKELNREATVGHKAPTLH